MSEALAHQAVDPLQVAEESSQLSALFNSIGDGVLATDEFGKITRINPAGLAILGYKERELLNQWFPQKIIATDESGTPMALIDRPITRAFLSGKSVSEHLHYLRKDGKPVPLAVTLSPLVLKNRPIGAIEVFRDITLEEEVDRMKSEFISLASHQLRTPLSSIKTYTHMLLDGYMGDITGPQRRSLTTIAAATNRMNELISTLLNITRIESGSITVAPKLINLRKLAEEVIKELVHTATSKDITLQLKVDTKSSTLKTDGLIVKEIITNLMTNGIKYTPNGGLVTIRITAHGGNLIVSVEDSGFGIPKSAHSQIFTKFYRAGNVVRRETSGTGLGLYLVKGLTDELGGKIWFESEENQGTTFYLSLPGRMKAGTAQRPKTARKKL